MIGDAYFAQRHGVFIFDAYCLGGCEDIFFNFPQGRSFFRNLLIQMCKVTFFLNVTVSIHFCQTPS